MERHIAAAYFHCVRESVCMRRTFLCAKTFPPRHLTLAPFSSPADKLVCMCVCVCVCVYVVFVGTFCAIVVGHGTICAMLKRQQQATFPEQIDTNFLYKLPATG